MAAQMMDAGGSAGPEDSIWSQIGNAFTENKDLIATMAGKYAQYEKQKADNRAQDYINQAAAKWSGFQPGLTNLIKPTETANPAALAFEAITEAPKLWYDVDKLYEARRAAKNGDDSKMESINGKAMNMKVLEALAQKYGVK